jgi:hypothetical protein
MPEKKVDLIPKLARRRSQDFASKIQGWNSNGGGVVHQEAGKNVASGKSKVKVAQDKSSKDALKAAPGAGAGEKSKAAQVTPQEDKAMDDAAAPEDIIEVVIEEDASALAMQEDGEQQAGLEAGGLNTPGAAPKPITMKKPGRGVDMERRAWVRRKVKVSPQEPQVGVAPDDDVKHAGTPKKRVVSDSNWLRNRPDQNKQQGKRKDATPKPIVIRRSFVTVGLKVPPSSFEYVEADAPLSRPSAAARSRSSSPSSSEYTRESAPQFAANGTRIFVSKRRTSPLSSQRRRQDRGHRISDGSGTAPSSYLERASSATDITSPSHSTADSARPLSEPRKRVSRTSSREHTQFLSLPKMSPKEEHTRAVPRSDTRATPTSKIDERDGRSPKDKSRTPSDSHQKPMLTSIGPGLPRQHGTRIEGWLADTSDPFVSKSNSSLAPLPLAIPKKGSRGKISPSGPREIRKTSPRTGRGGRTVSPDQSSDRTPTEELLNRSIDEWSDVSPSVTSTLRRSGARRTIKGRNPRGRDSAGSKETTAREAVDTPVRTTRAISSAEAFQSRPKTSDGRGPQREALGSKLRAAKQSELVSGLSLAQDDPKSIRSSRSLRMSRRMKVSTTVGEVMNEISRDEMKYQRELRTLVDGVIPVLLQYALAGDESADRARVFTQSAVTADVTKPIVDMGIALERLKNAHRKIPMHEPSDLVIWAESTTKAYGDYITSWHMGFKNIVVNLAPADTSATDKIATTWDEGILRNKDGDLVNGDGERVDVAHLLKRPLARVKNLSRVFANLQQIQPAQKTEEMAKQYQALVDMAKERVTNEHARLEDEAAASIDSSRARDPRSLAPITGVTIDPSRCVRARDYFDMDLTHSSGQQLCCKIEIIYRDDAPDRGSSGDVLFCEVSASGRWLLFPPLPTALVTARKGERSSELVVMIRGFLASAQQWREVMVIRADQEQTSVDWLQMLGSSPMPPARISRKSSFNVRKQLPEPGSTTRRPVSGLITESIDEPSQRELEVPFGVRSKFASSIWDGSEVNSVRDEKTPLRAQKHIPSRYRSSPDSPHRVDSPYATDSECTTQPDYYHERSRRQRSGTREDKRPVSSHTRSHSEWTSSSMSATTQDYSVWMPESRVSDESSTEEDDARETRHRPRSISDRRRFSVPSSRDLLTVPNPRPLKPDQPNKASTPSRYHTGRRKTDTTGNDLPVPSSAPSKLQKRAPPAPEHKERPQASSSTRPSFFGLKSTVLPALTPAFMRKSRRPSSPLKHEYEPSSDSDSLSDSDVSELSDSDSVTSGSVTGEQGENISTIGDLKAFHQYSMRPPAHTYVPGPALRNAAADDSTMSEVVSPAPAYRNVPPPSARPSMCTASIFSWADRGAWESLHPEECCIFVSPGLIEAYDISQARAVMSEDKDGLIATPCSKGVKPLVALELTPLVPLRRGTAVDISIRSPPTPGSLLRAGNNVMFRSHNPDDCEKLYALINRARIDNPTYIALSKARGPTQQSNWGEVMDRRPAARPSSSWWNIGSRKSSTYRSNGSRPVSIAATESSVGTMNSAFSALRRFSSGNRIWNIAKSTITSREGTRSTNSGTISSGGAATPIPLDPRLGTPVGITNAKIRLYIRESSYKWKDLGSARLTVMLPPRQDPAVAANPKATGLEKRVLIYGKSQGEVLLDATLGEQCFERIARTGIAVSVWQENTGPNGETGFANAVGGVGSAKSRVFMVQMKSVSSFLLWAVHAD